MSDREPEVLWQRLSDGGEWLDCDEPDAIDLVTRTAYRFCTVTISEWVER